MRPTPAGWFWLGYLLLVVSLFLGYCTKANAAFSRSDRRVAYLAVICPPDWIATISQRHDEGTIWRPGTWVHGCTDSYRIEWKDSNRGIR
jgi:hypothetical protein